MRAEAAFGWSRVCPEVSSDPATLTSEPADPADPNDIEVDIPFEPDHTDLVLSSVPGGELFNPRKHKFKDEDLKPQPMIKKAKKVLVPEERKVRLCFGFSKCQEHFLVGVFLLGNTHKHSPQEEERIICIQNEIQVQMRC